MDALLERQEDSLSSLFSFLVRESPRVRIENDARRLDDLAERGQMAFRHLKVLQEARFSNLAGRMAALDPARVLQRGYAVIRAEDGSSIRSTRQVAKGQQLEIEVTDGTFGAQVNSTAVNH